MADQEEMIPKADAIRAVELTCRRLGLLHLAFAMTLVKELGEEKGEELTTKAIKEYARMIGEKKKAQAEDQGLELTVDSFRKLSDLPALGMHSGREEVVVEGEKRARVYGCVMSQVWREYDQDKLGRIYCYVDPASTMALQSGLQVCPYPGHTGWRRLLRTGIQKHNGRGQIGVPKGEPRFLQDRKRPLNTVCRIPGRFLLDAVYHG